MNLLSYIQVLINRYQKYIDNIQSPRIKTVISNYKHFICIAESFINLNIFSTVLKSNKL